jgi:hypothetical protein
VFGVGKGNLCAKLKSRVYDTDVVGSHDNLVESFSFETARPDVLDERLAGNAV